MLFVCLTRNSSNTKTQNVERQLRKIQEHTEPANGIDDTPDDVKRVLIVIGSGT